MNEPNKPTLQDFGKAISAALAAKKAQQAMNAAKPVEAPQISGGLTKPARQVISDIDIEWVWEGFTGTGCYIEARYLKSDGSYNVILCTNAEAIDISADEAKAIGEALLSAALWETTWQQHAGEFLAHPSSRPVEENVVAMRKATQPRKRTPKKRTPRKAP